MPPSSEEQVRFLVNLQRLLSEGLFVATYKFALLLSLADISVERGDDLGEPLTVSTTAIAEKFIAYYWRQSVPYGGARVLQQNTGRQAAVVRVLEQARAQYGNSLSGVIQKPAIRSKLIREVDQVVRVMPLWKLQTVGQEHLDFLYENTGSATSIVLRPGVAYCFRQFYELISDLVRGAWLRNVRQQNLDVVGESTDLTEFLFGSERANLGLVRGVLQEFQSRCFYCGSDLKPATTEVDHFISWSRYPADLGHNFVLADRSCNNAKRDRLPAHEYLCAWVERNEKFSAQLAAGFGHVGVLHNLGASVRIANWAYSQTDTAKGLTWRRADELVALPEGWREPLGRLWGLMRSPQSTDHQCT